MPRIKLDLEVLGTFTNSKGEQKDAFLRYNKEKKGYVIHDLNTLKVLVPTAFPTLTQMVEDGIAFKDNGQRRDSTLVATRAKELVAA